MVAPDNTALPAPRPGQWTPPVYPPVRLLVCFLAWSEAAPGTNSALAKTQWRFLSPQESFRLVRTGEKTAVVKDEHGARWRCPVGFLATVGGGA